MTTTPNTMTDQQSAPAVKPTAALRPGDAIPITGLGSFTVAAAPIPLPARPPTRHTWGPDPALRGPQSPPHPDPAHPGLSRSGPSRHADDGRWGAYTPVIHRWEHLTGRPAPDPCEPAPRGGRRLAPRFVEWLMGLPAGWVTDVPDLTRNQQLRLLGNGVVPAQGAAAFALLLADLPARLFTGPPTDTTTGAPPADVAAKGAA
jgi:hypothetical protein